MSFVFRCCHDLLHSFAMKIRAVSGCSCLLLPIFFHAITSSRTCYDSLSLELFPLFACSRHVIIPSSDSGTSVCRPASPYKLIRFNSDGTYSPLFRPGQLVTPAKPAVMDSPLNLSRDSSISTSVVIPGAVFSNSSVAPVSEFTSSTSLPTKTAQFTNHS